MRVPMGIALGFAGALVLGSMYEVWSPILPRLGPWKGIAPGAAHPMRLVPVVTDGVHAGRRYRGRQLAWSEAERHIGYQRLRGEIFVGQLGWDIPLTSDGRETDGYDLGGDPTVSVHCVYGVEKGGFELLLGGVRLFALRTWDDGMFANDFSRVGIVSPAVLAEVARRYQACDVVEMTRLCVRPGRWYGTPTEGGPFALPIARDLVYAAVYGRAALDGRKYALAIVDLHYVRLMRRSHFIFEQFDLSPDPHYDGPPRYAVVMVDLAATIAAIRNAGDGPRAARMLSLTVD